jgi:hypothetical protein
MKLVTLRHAASFDTRNVAVAFGCVVTLWPDAQFGYQLSDGGRRVVPGFGTGKGLRLINLQHVLSSSVVKWACG